MIRIWSPHRHPLLREQLLWCAGMNTSECMWLNIVSYYCLLENFSEVNSKSLSHRVTLSCTSEEKLEIKSCFGFFCLSHAKLFERFISNSYSCQTDLKLWNFINAQVSPEPSSNQAELKLSKACVQSNTSPTILLRSGHVHQRQKFFFSYSSDWTQHHLRSGREWCLLASLCIHLH